jgi:hypothetical protein
LTLTKDQIIRTATAAESREDVAPDIDQFEYPTAAQFLPAGVMVNL